MSLTYELIKSANERVETIELKGKRYASVAARVQAFRELCPEGCIATEYEFREDSKGAFVICKTTVCDETGRVLATGMAYEREGSTQVNRTSYIENCETSAVGRALGMLGLGSQTSMASAEEMANALYQQTAADKALETAMYVDEDGDRDAGAEREKCWQTIKGLFEMNGKTSEDAQAWVEKRFGLAFDEINLKQMRDAKIAVAKRANE